MRGPGYRHDLDVRRMWRCVKCGKQRRLAGDVTTVTCACGQPMELVEPPRRANYAPQPLANRELTVESFALTEEELSRPVAARPRQGPRDNAAAPPESPPGGAGPSRPPRRQRTDRGPAAPPDDAFAAGLDDPPPV